MLTEMDDSTYLQPSVILILTLILHALTFAILPVGCQICLAVMSITNLPKGGVQPIISSFTSSMSEFICLYVYQCLVCFVLCNVTFEFFSAHVLSKNSRRDFAC